MTRYFCLLLALVAPALHAQTSIDVGALDSFFQTEPKVEVNLKGSLLRLIVEASREDEPEFAEMVRGLNAVTVRVYDLDSALGGLDGRLSRLGSDLEANGWSTLVRVRADADEDDEDVWIYVLDDGSVIDGLAVMSLDRTEGDVSFVLIDGTIDPAQIGRLSARFGGPDIDGVEPGRRRGPMSRLPLALVLLAALAASGCGSSELRGLRNDIVRSTPEMRLGDGMSLSLGPVSLGLARAFVPVDDDADGALVSAALRSLRRVQFAAYEVSGAFDPQTAALPATLSRYLDDGWTPVVVVRDSSEVVWLLAEDAEPVDEVLMVTLSAEDLFLAKLRGDLTEVARVALAQASAETRDEDGTD